MTGSFSSEEQATADSSYFDIRLQMARIWSERTEGFVGGTEGKGCASDLRRATYATSEVVVKLDHLTSWDRGFDKSDRQVWGAEKGGYVFLKLPSAPAEKQTNNPPQ